MALRRLQREWRLIAQDLSPLFTAWPQDDNLSQWEAVIMGPEDSPYECGLFSLSITYPDQYPFRSPSVLFKTPIYHPCVDRRGQVDLDILHGYWSPALTIRQLLLSIWVLLTNYSVDDPLDPAIAAQCKNNPAQFNETARQWTLKYAIL